VRCGHRPSKRVEQLVHLRLKSIYKAFKQSGAALTTPGSRAITDGKGGAPDATRVAAAAALARAAGLPGESLDAAFDSLTPESELALAGDVGAVLQAAAAAANSNSSNRLPGNPFRSNSNASSGSQSKALNNSSAGSRTEEEAKAAEAALLAELDEEEEKKAKKSKKSKKKKSKKEALAKEKAEKEEQERLQAEEQRRLKEELEEMERRIAEAKLEEKRQTQASAAPPAPVVDEMETVLEALIDSVDIEGIESFLQSLKGVPGKAALRKNAKKAIRRLTPSAADSAAAAAATASPAHTPVAPVDTAKSTGCKISGPPLQASPYVRGEGELLVVVSTQQKDTRTELIANISPAVVGWVIGKGGMRIKELMEKSSAKIWIDQDSMKANENRIMYISGKKNAVESAYRAIEELVSKSPMGIKDAESKARLVNKGGGVKPAASTTPSASEDFPPPTTVGNDAGGPLPPSIAGAECTARLTCEPRFVALLIGRRGWTVKHIQDVSGARVDIDQSVTPREVTISGTQKSVATAQRLVRDVLSYPNAQLHYNDKENPSGDPDVSAAAAAKAQVEAAAKAAEDAAKTLNKIQKQQEEEIDRLKQLQAQTAKAESDRQKREQQQQYLILQQMQQEQQQQQIQQQQQQQQQQQRLQQQQHQVSLSQQIPLPPPPNMPSPNIGGESLLGGGLSGGSISGGGLSGGGLSGGGLSDGGLSGGGLSDLWGGAQNSSPALGGPSLWGDNSSAATPNGGVDSIFGSGALGGSALGGGSGALGGDLWSGGSLLPSGLVDDLAPSASSGGGLNSLPAPPPGMLSSFGGLSSTRNIDSFLKTLGLERYCSLLKEHEIDLDVLKLMSEFDLARMGVPLGPRVKIMQARESY